MKNARNHLSLALKFLSAHFLKIDLASPSDHSKRRRGAFLIPVRPLFMAAARYLSSSRIEEPFVMCPFPHSVDHTGDSRNEEAESIFMGSQSI